MNPLRNHQWAAALQRCVLAAFAAAIATSPLAQGTDAVLLEVTRYTIEGANPLSEQDTQAILAPHLGKHRSLNTVEAAAVALEAALRERGYSFHRVIVPAQRPTGGEVKLRILQFPLAQVTVTNNHYFTSENILASLPSLQPGTPPEVRVLARDLSLANEHPAKRLTIHIKESQKPDHLDAEVRVRDAPASVAFASLTGGSRDRDDSINRNTGYTRLTLGYQNSNLFERDHALTLTYTTSPDHIDKVTQLGAFYWAPLYGYHTTLNAYWSKSDVDTGSVGVGTQSFNVSGRGEFWGLKATYALPKLGTVNQQAALAFDSRYFESEVTSGGLLQRTPVGSRPLTLRYLARHEQAEGGIGGYVEYLSNLDGGSSNDAGAYTAARTGAPQRWNAWRYGIDAQYTLSGGWSLVGRFRGQHTRDALVPGEQFGLGGVGSVRGLRDRETSGDKGYTINLEAHAPQLSWGLTPYLFYDAGRRSYVVPPTAATPNTESASSAGVGGRWNWQRNLEINATLATVIDGLSPGASPVSDSGHTKLNFSLFYRF